MRNNDVVLPMHSDSDSESDNDNSQILYRNPDIDQGGGRKKKLRDSELDSYH